MGGNLPPGVTTNMIPGNRPQDLARQSMREEVEDMPVAEFLDCFPTKSDAWTQLDALVQKLADQRLDDLDAMDADGPHGGDGPED
jgi:hypothetical protein